MINIGDKALKALYHGDQAISRVYRGGKVVWGKNVLPGGYIQCEYLSSNGKQYIRTDYRITIRTGFELDYALTTNALESSMYMMAGRINGGSIYGFGGSKSLTTTTALWTSANSVGLTLLETRTTDRHNIRNLEYGAYVDGKYIGMQNRDDPKGETVFIFAGGTSSEGKMNIIDGMRCFGAKLYEGANVTMSFVPALDDTGKPCLYDLISRRPFYNAGTGEFGYKLMDGTYVAPI